MQMARVEGDGGVSPRLGCVIKRMRELAPNMRILCSGTKHGNRGKGKQQPAFELKIFISVKNIFRFKRQIRWSLCSLYIGSMSESARKVLQLNSLSRNI